MATPADQLDELIATTLEAIRPELSDNVTNDLPLLAFLNMKSKVGLDGGRTIVRPLMYALNDTVASYTGYDTADMTAQGGIGEAIYEWKNLFGSVVISGEEVRKNSGRAAIIKLLGAKVEQLKLSVEDEFNAQLHGDGTGNSSKDFMGLKGLVDNDSVLGGIDPATETWWKSDVRTTALDLTVPEGVTTGLNNMFNSLAIKKSRPTIELTTQDNFEAYEGLAVEKIRYTNTRMADLGFEAIAHKTAEVVFDADTPNDAADSVDGGYWYFINSDFVEFVQHPAAWFTMTDFVRPHNQDAKAALILCMGNLVTSNRRAHGVFRRTIV